ncbi:MAG: hypothetical protein Q9201_006572, partial [Fulgogasparrea decipioides]
MDAPRLLVLIFLLLILFSSPDTRTVSPSQQRELGHLVARERHALSLLDNARYGDLNAAENRWINVTGLRQEDGYAWDLLPKVQERARQQARTVFAASHWSHQQEQVLIDDAGTEAINGSLAEPTLDPKIPIYRNVTGIVHGRWVRSNVANGTKAPSLNLTALVPRVTYTTAKYARNILGIEGDLRIRLDEKRSESVGYRNTTVREISGDITLQDESSTGDGWDMTLHGVHYPQEGAIVLTTTGQRFAGIFALPHFSLSERAFASTRKLLNYTLNEAIKIQESASEISTFSPWSSSPQSPSDLLFSTPHCEYIVYLQQHPLDVRSSDIESIETEMRYPTGRWNLPSPRLKMSALVFSPDCGFVLESKGPPDYAPQHGYHLQGPKIEAYILSGRRAILAFAVTICAEVSLLLRQMREASTPSTRSRISFYTVGMMAMGDGFVCMSFLVISILLDAAFLPLTATAFLAFLCVSFFGMKFLMDIWTVQEPEREERRRQRERRHAAVNTTSRPLVPAPSAVLTPAGADTLPLPVTAPRSTSSHVPSGVNPQTQGLIAEAPVPTNPTTTLPNVQATPANAARREMSGIYTRFYLLLVVILFLTLYSSTWPPLLRTVYVRLLSMGYLSFWTPQILRNIIRNCRKALQWRFVVGQSVLRILPFFYIYLCTDNVLLAETSSHWVIALFGWVWIQVWILVSQELFGPRFFVPKACSNWIPAAYDYHPTLREEDEESGLSIPIGFTQATASSQDPAVASASSSNGVGTGEKAYRQKGKKTFDCAICMQTLEVPVVPRGAEGGSIPATTAGIGAGVKDLVFGRRAYMVTP